MNMVKRISSFFGLRREIAEAPLTAEELADIQRGEADMTAGRVVPHEEVVRWLRSWGTDHELPRPTWRK